MSNSVLKIFKETIIPSTLQPNSLYMVAPVDNPTYVEFYVTGLEASVVRRTLNQADIAAIVAQHISVLDINNLIVVNDIDDRDNLNPSTNTFVFVKDATGDSTVSVGSASYIYEVLTSTYTKIAEYESSNLVLSWANIVDGPISTPAAVDDAVSSRHSHANATQLAKIGENAEGNLTYDGVIPLAGLSSANW